MERKKNLYLCACVCVWVGHKKCVPRYYKEREESPREC